MKRKSNILILGGFGFIGRNLTEELLSSGRYNVVIFDSPTFPVDYIPPRPDLSVCLGDFSSPGDLQRVFSKYQFDTVVHLISTTIPSTSNGVNMVYDIETNLVPTLRLLSVMRENDAGKIVFASSGGTVYGPASALSRQPIPETAPTSPICSHGIIKLTIEKYLALYKHLHGLDYLVLRIANPFGEYHRSEVQGLINVALRKAIKGENIQVWGDGKIVRDYIYIKDCVSAMRCLIEKDVVNETINIGSGIGYSVNEVLAVVSAVTGNLKVKRSAARSFDTPKVVLDVSKLRRMTGVRPVSLEEGILRTYRWLCNPENVGRENGGK